MQFFSCSARLALVTFSLLGTLANNAFAAADDPAWSALKQGGYVVLMRHAQTVAGTGDPPNFKINDCSTQRNLDSIGKAQSQRWGEAFRANRVPLSGVYSSQWCRCVDTASLAFKDLARVDTWPALNSHFDNPQTADLQKQQVLGGLGVRLRAGQNIVLVTHQVNITALTGQFVGMGEALVTRFEGGALRVVQRLPMPKPQR
jgi:broad specificity phosphatase PhoE